MALTPSKRTTIIALGVAAVLVAILVSVLVAQPWKSDERHASRPPPEEGDDEGAPWLFGDGDERDPSGGADESRGGGGRWGGGDGEGGGRGRRGGWRGWRDGGMTPEQWRARMRRRVEIVALGARAPALQPEDVMRAMRDQRPRMRECIDAAGGFAALRGAFRGGADGGRRGRSVTLDFDSSGAVVPSSISFDPPMSGQLAQCMSSALSGVRVDGSQVGDGARVEVRMGGGRGGGGRFGGGGGEGGFGGGGGGGGGGRGGGP